jgi:hypothetical protein
MATARQEVDRSPRGEAQDGRGLPLRLGMEGVGTKLRAVLQEPVQEVHGVPHPPGHQAAEPGTIGLGHVGVAEASPPAVPQVVLTQEVLFIDVPLGAVRGGPRARAPACGA